MVEQIQNKNIWIFHHYATPPTMNGYIRPYNFGVNLINQGYNVKVFSASHLHLSGINLIDDNKLYIENKETDIPFAFVKTNSYSENDYKRVVNMFSYYRNLFKAVKDFINKGEKPDLIIASSPHPLAMIAGIKIAKKLNVPCINEIRDFWPEVFFKGDRIKESSIIGKTLVKGEHWIYKKSDAIIFLKEGDYTYITDKKWDLDQGGDIDLKKCYYINNGVDIEKFETQKDNFKLEDDDLNSEKFNVIYTGAIRPVNNVGNILDAAKLLQNEESIQFLIYGDGNQIDPLRKRIKNEEIKNVKIKGYADKKYMPYILSKGSVNLLNYSQEKYNWSRGNSSNKLFEYMASGKPIISTVKMGYCLLEKYNCGISIENDTPENLANSIEDLYNMSRTQYNKLSENAKQAAKDFDYKRLTEKLIKVMERHLT